MGISSMPFKQAESFAKDASSYVFNLIQMWKLWPEVSPMNCFVLFL